MHSAARVLVERRFKEGTPGGCCVKVCCTPPRTHPPPLTERMLFTVLRSPGTSSEGQTLRSRSCFSCTSRTVLNQALPGNCGISREVSPPRGARSQGSRTSSAQDSGGETIKTVAKNKQTPLPVLWRCHYQSGTRDGGRDVRRLLR